ncbi:MAG: ribonuclease HI family protein [Candidatus Paceibacterota bacterium]|nr:MAG: ribonuclease HI family protein [Candidatus Paceibacterota bacterium]
MNTYNIWTDGGARGNPGPAAIGFVISGEGVEDGHGAYIGETTNNVAEYRAVIEALRKLKLLIGAEAAKGSAVIVRADSQLVVRQALGEYRVKEAGLKQLFMELWNARQDFHSVDFIHIPREENGKADGFVNRALDEREARQRQGNLV